MFGLLRLLALGLAIALCWAVWLVYRRLRRPPRKTYASAVARGRPGDPSECHPPRAWREFSFRAPVDRARFAELSAWEIMGDDRLGPVIVCTPGWGDSRLGALVRLRALGAVSSRVIAWDPAGSGESPGLCNLGSRSDVDALIALVDAIAPTLGGAPLVLYGWSLGAGVSIVGGARLAERAEPLAVGGVIGEAPYRVPMTPARSVMDLAGLPWRANLPIAMALLGVRLGEGAGWKGFDRAKWAARLRCPLLVVHGSHDEVCPVEDGRAIASAADHGMFIEVEGASHNNLWTEEPFATQADRAVRDFARAIAPA
ncbi:MAG TPA: hypothetical protein DEB06_00570 [Phycisphaerales bacterium]|nr:hypothetical protein [Phycisphaerales bacterium]